LVSPSESSGGGAVEESLVPVLTVLQDTWKQKAKLTLGSKGILALHAN